MSKEIIKLRKEMDLATTEMGRTSSFPELYATAKAKHTEAKRKLIQLMSK